MTVSKNGISSQTSDRHTLSVLVSYNLNALSRIIGIFSGKGFHIDSISFGSEKESDLARITITTHGDEQIIEQITKQLHKIIDVVTVTDLTYERFVERELALIKVTATRSSRSEIMQIAQVFRAKVIDISPGKLSIEVTGNRDKINAFIGMLDPFGIDEISRTGSVALKREFEGSV
ncbi:acetolactate synthase small subunit [Aliifodinibius salicampi]|uniref:Acetolactate synthase small subunit n=1 Tax=Fodinibius salicampi TaxID=1920655 RepID=A0ABT3Q001_9BACT|nr:acetolactate synthase small subunit [Fodinibius salicampi]MCW9713405.1 acetolactate synthase small subunit [Fodinibius salicampi]